MNKLDNIDGDKTGKNKKKLDKTAKEIAEFINQTIQKQIVKEVEKETMQPYVSNEKKQIQKDIAILDSTVSEFLQNFMIIGFDLYGNRVTIFHAKNTLERDAILEHLRSIIMNLVNGEGPS